MPALQQLSDSTTSAETPVNENFETLSWAAMFGKNQPTTSGLIWGYYGTDAWPINGVPSSIAAGTVTLTANTTNYVEVSAAGVVSKATTRSADKAPLYKIVTGASGVNAGGVTDERDAAKLARLAYGRVAIAMANANVTLSQAQALCDSLELTGANTAVRNVVVPAIRRGYTVFANTTTNGVQVLAASGTGTTIAVGKRAIVEFDGTNVVRITADV